MYGVIMVRTVFQNEFTYKNFVEQGKESEFHRLFEEAITRVKSEFGKTYPIYIGGKEVTTGELLEERSPVDSSIVVGRFQKGTRKDAKMAIEAARSAFESWKNTDYKERAAIFSRFADLISKNKFTIAAALSYENAKSVYESIGEVDEAIDFARYYAGELLANKGYSRKTILGKSSADVSAGFQGAPSESERVTIAMKPYGVFGVIAPFNFPVSISMGMSIGAIITGNTIVFKPSSTDNMTMLVELMLYKLLVEAGLPAGVFNYVTGPGSEVGDEITMSKQVSGIAFTGSRTTGMGMISRCFAAGMQKVFVVEMGGKNPAIVSKHANLDVAVKGVAGAAFGFAGQKCSALSRVYVDESVKEVFISKLIEKVRGMRIGNPLDKDVYLGPLISKSAYDRYMESVEIIKNTGKLLYGGNKVDVGLKGYYVEPVLAEVQHSSEIATKELFAPILAIIGYKNFEDAVAMADDTEYGLTAGLYSLNKKEIRQFSERIEAGVVYVNRGISATTGAIVGLHTFVGWKGSALTGKGSGSKFYLPQFMREQSLSITEG